jgi:polyisoprenoid-binding protein YceI
MFMNERPSMAASRALIGGHWLADTQQSSVELVARHLGLLPVRGTVPILAGLVTIDPDTNRTEVLFRLDAAGFDTGNAKRDHHVKSADFLATEHFPHFTFRSADLRFDRTDPARFCLDGALTVRGTTRLVTLFSELTERSADGGVGETVRLTASTTIRRSLFGVSKLPFVVSERIRVRISLTLRRSAEGGAA